jgi:hypothetical protein
MLDYRDGETSYSNWRAAAVVDPLDGKMWRCSPIAIEEIKDAFDDETGGVPWGELVNRLPPELHHAFHVLRIAHLVKNRSSEPIILAANRSTDGDGARWIVDGNHRMAAAIVSGDQEVLV